jgi:ethanolamine ammonia-lyase small subunit
MKPKPEWRTRYDHQTARDVVEYKIDGKWIKEEVMLTDPKYKEYQ